MKPNKQHIKLLGAVAEQLPEYFSEFSIKSDEPLFNEAKFEISNLDDDGNFSAAMHYLTDPKDKTLCLLQEMDHLTNLIEDINSYLWNAENARNQILGIYDDLRTYHDEIIHKLVTKAFRNSDCEHIRRFEKNELRDSCVVNWPSWIIETLQYFYVGHNYSEVVGYILGEEDEESTNVELDSVMINGVKYVRAK